jgi:hypothetical protein
MPLVDVILSFPTVVYTVLVAIALVYWLFVVIGAIDLDGGAHADAGLEGHAHAAAHHAGHGHADAHGAHAGSAQDHDADADAGVLDNILSALKLRNAPVTVVASLFALFGWLGSGLVLASFGSTPGWIVRSGLFAGSAVVSLVVTSIVIRPLGGIFNRKSAGVRDSDLHGKIVVVSTGRVDEKFGQATYEEKGASLTIQVRADAKAGLKKGARCVIVDHDPAAGTFSIEPLPESEPRLRVASPGSHALAGDEPAPAETVEREDQRRG